MTVSNVSISSGQSSEDNTKAQDTKISYQTALNNLKLLATGIDCNDNRHETTTHRHAMGNTERHNQVNDGTPTDIEKNIQVAVVICGMALRLPAGLRSPQQLWQFLLAKGDARSKVPKSRYNVSAFYDSTGKPGTVKTEHGYFLDEDIGHLDTSFFSMARMEVERVDPQQRLMLEVTRECLEDAGVTDYRGSQVGCYVGSLGEDWCEMFARKTQNWGNYRITGHGDFALANRVSYEMDLRGPWSVDVQ